MTGHQEGRYIPPRRERDRKSGLLFGGSRWQGSRWAQSRYFVHARMAASLVLPLYLRGSP
jgi:hypothetical protein